MTSNRRTECAPFLLDLLDFMEEKIREAIDDDVSRAGAISEAAGAIPLLRDRLRENEDVQAGFMLVFDVQFLEPQATPWWAEFARMGRTEFEKQAQHLIGPQGILAVLRTVVAAGEGADSCIC